jgi:hypothetical protein
MVRGEDTIHAEDTIHVDTTSVADRETSATEEEDATSDANVGEERRHAVRRELFHGAATQRPGGAVDAVIKHAFRTRV